MEDTALGEHRSVYADATSQAHGGAPNGAGRAGEGSEQSRYMQWKESLSHAGQALADRARNTARATNDYAHQEPWKLVGLGAAVGVIIGMLIASGRR